MNSLNGESRRNNAGERFREWASLFSERLFVILQVFADESSTYKEATTPSLSGFIQSADYWPVFCRKWKRVLDDYNAPFFHYREWVDKDDKWKIKGNPFLTWTEKKREGFLYDLALLCSERAVPLVGSYDAGQHRKRSLEGTVYEGVIHAFFESVDYVLKTHWPHYRGKVAFVFDDGTPIEWTTALHKVHQEYAETDPRLIGTLAFSDDKEILPLQAADLYANIMRQHAERQLKRRSAGDSSLEPMRLLDFIFRKNMEPNGPYMNSQELKTWKSVIMQMLAHQRKMQAQWKRDGNPRKYYPVEHFPHLFTYPDERTKPNTI